MKNKKCKLSEGNYSSEYISQTRVVCKCGHTVNFVSKITYLECSHCHNLIFKNPKCEFDYRIKRRFAK